jgi:hypothetical protein
MLYSVLKWNLRYPYSFDFIGDIPGLTATLILRQPGSEKDIRLLQSSQKTLIFSSLTYCTIRIGANSLVRTPVTSDLEEPVKNKEPAVVFACFERRVVCQYLRRNRPKPNRRLSAGSYRRDASRTNRKCAQQSKIRLSDIIQRRKATKNLYYGFAGELYLLPLGGNRTRRLG